MLRVLGTLMSREIEKYSCWICNEYQASGVAGVIVAIFGALEPGTVEGTGFSARHLTE